MKALWIAAIVSFFVCGAFRSHAQYKAPSQYFPKNFAAPGRDSAPAKPPGPAQGQPAKPQQPKFKDLSVNSTFYFLSDTNRAYPWVKLSDISAKNNKNGITRQLSAETLILR